MQTPIENDFGVSLLTNQMKNGEPAFVKKKSLPPVKPDSPLETNVMMRNPSATTKTPKIRRKAVRRVRAQAHFGGTVEASENIQRIDKEKDPETISLIKSALKNHFVFTFLNDSQIERISWKFFYCKANGGQLVFKQDTEANSFFIIEKGKLQVCVNDKEKKVLGAGNCFGELALLYNAPRSASILAMEDSYLWGIDGPTFRQIVQEITVNDFNENRTFIEKIPLFKNLTPDQKGNITSILIKQRFQPNVEIVNEGDNANSYYIIKKGTVSVLKGDTVVRTMKEGETFGEAALLEDNNVRQMSIKALTEVVCLALGGETLISILGDKVQNIASRNLVRWAFEQDPLLSQLTAAQKEKIFENTKPVKEKPGYKVLQKGELCDKLIIPVDGSLIEENSEQVVCDQGSIFGASYLLSENQGKKIADDIILDYEGMHCEIHFKEFESLLGGPLEVILQENKALNEKKQSEPEALEEQKDIDIPLSSLIFIQKIGQGQFGSVFLVEDAQGKRYALKAVSKARVHALCLEKHVQDELNVLKKLKSPFIMGFYRTYKDQDNIYFLTEYIRGMELFDVIREIGLLTKKEAQFYIANIALAIEYLHTQNIIYRDLKPENVIVDLAGYPKLIDMGTCKILGKYGARTYTIIGTPTYMAPEVISGKGYTVAVDYWSLGICLYEFICGMVPFGESSDDPYEIYNEILMKKLEFPYYMNDEDAMALLCLMLDRLPEKRAAGGFTAIKGHKWFGSKFDWSQILEKKMKAPYIPPPEKVLSDVELTIQRNKNLGIVQVLQNEPKEEVPMYMSGSETITWDQDF